MKLYVAITGALLILTAFSSIHFPLASASRGWTFVERDTITCSVPSLWRAELFIEILFPDRFETHFGVCQDNQTVGGEEISRTATRPHGWSLSVEIIDPAGTIVASGFDEGHMMKMDQAVLTVTATTASGTESATATLELTLTKL